LWEVEWENEEFLRVIFLRLVPSLGLLESEVEEFERGRGEEMGGEVERVEEAFWATF